MNDQDQSIQPRWLRIQEAADYACISASKLAKDRLAGTGIPFVKNGRVILYDRRDIDEYLTARKMRSTSEAKVEASCGTPAARVD